MNKNPSIKLLTKEGEEPQPVELLEAAIIEIAAGMKKLGQSRLKREAVVLLLHDASKVGKPDIRAVLQSMEQLEATYLKPKQK